MPPCGIAFNPCRKQNKKNDVHYVGEELKVGSQKEQQHSPPLTHPPQTHPQQTAPPLNPPTAHQGVPTVPSASTLSGSLYMSLYRSTHHSKLSKLCCQFETELGGVYCVRQRNHEHAIIFWNLLASLCVRPAQIQSCPQKLPTTMWQGDVAGQTKGVRLDEPRGASPDYNRDEVLVAVPVPPLWLSGLCARSRP